MYFLYFVKFVCIESNHTSASFLAIVQNTTFRAENQSSFYENFPDV